MSTYRPVSLSFLLILCLLWPASHAKAQCSKSSSGFMEVGLVSGNPFSAERVSTRSNPSPFLAAASALDHPQLIARDSQGRVRIDRVAGMFRMKSGPEEGQELEQHLIYICDPVNQTLTQLDSVNKTARISHSGPIAPLPNNFSTSPQLSICASKSKLNFARAKVEDLGHKDVQGFDSQGVRFTMTPLVAPTEGYTASTSVREEWCSEELAAVVLQTMSSIREGKASFTTNTTLTKIERVEPDPALFQIPPGYTISELVPNRPMRRPALLPQAPAAPTTTQAPASPQ